MATKQESGQVLAVHKLVGEEDMLGYSASGTRPPLQGMLHEVLSAADTGNCSETLT